MKLYIANGTYVGTQADAKAITKQFTEVEVPTDKAGLIGYLNTVATFRDPFAAEDDYETVVARQDPAVDVLDPAHEAAAALYTAWQKANAEITAIWNSHRPVAEQWIDKPDPRKDAEARKSFAAWPDNTADDDEDTEDTEEVVEQDPFA